MKMKKPTLVLKETAAEQSVNNGMVRPKNPSANVLPTVGYVLEIDGKSKSEYETLEAATKVGLELKKKYPQIQVKVFDAKKRTRVLVDLTEKPEMKTGIAV
jgi:hypothetical protein